MIGHTGALVPLAETEEERRRRMAQHLGTPAALAPLQGMTQSDSQSNLTGTGDYDDPVDTLIDLNHPYGAYRPAENNPGVSDADRQIADLESQYRNIAAAKPKKQKAWKQGLNFGLQALDRKSTRLNSSHIQKSRMPSSA